MQAIMEATFFAKDMINCMQQTQASSIATELLVGRTVKLKANRACSIYFDTAIPVEMHVILSQLGGKAMRTVSGNSWTISFSILGCRVSQAVSRTARRSIIGIKVKRIAWVIRPLTFQRLRW